MYEHMLPGKAFLLKIGLNYFRKSLVAVICIIMSSQAGLDYELVNPGYDICSYALTFCKPTSPSSVIPEYSNTRGLSCDNVKVLRCSLKFP